MCAIVKTKNKKAPQLFPSNKGYSQPNIAQKWGLFGLGVKGIHRYSDRNRKVMKKAAHVVIRQAVNVSAETIL